MRDDTLRDCLLDRMLDSNYANLHRAAAALKQGAAAYCSQIDRKDLPAIHHSIWLRWSLRFIITTQRKFQVLQCLLQSPHLPQNAESGCDICKIGKLQLLLAGLHLSHLVCNIPSFLLVDFISQDLYAGSLDLLICWLDLQRIYLTRRQSLGWRAMGRTPITMCLLCTCA